MRRLHEALYVDEAHQGALAAELRLVEERLDELVDLVHGRRLGRRPHLSQGEHHPRERHRWRVHEVVPFLCVAFRRVD